MTVMTHFQKSFGPIVEINVKLLFAGLFGVIGYVMWPTNPKWWGLGFGSIVIEIAAVGLVIQAIRAMVGLYARDKALAEFRALGSAPKPSKLASSDALTKAGMTDA